MLHFAIGTGEANMRKQGTESILGMSVLRLQKEEGLWYRILPCFHLP
jgi:hypothetical protein